MKYFLLFTINLISSVSIMAQNYKILSTAECIRYMEKTIGREIQITDVYKTTPSESGLLFKMKNNTVVLIPSDFDSNYPGFIFDDERAVEQMIKEDFYPVGDKYMTVWELERAELNKLPQDVSYFKEYVLSRLGYKPVGHSAEEFKDFYNSFIKKNKKEKDLVLSQKLLVAFAVTVMDWMEKAGNGEWDIEQRYEQYNSYKYPCLKINGSSRDIIRFVMICAEGIPRDADFFLNGLDMKF